VVTHLDVAFVNPDAGGAVAMPGGLAEVVQTAHAKGVKVLVSMGGAGANASLYASLLGNAVRTDALVGTLVQATVDHDLDGVDVDIEGDVLDGKSVNAAQYEAFVTKLGTALRAKSKLMTAALGGWFAGHVTKTAVQQFDFLNVMSYDAYGDWSASPGQHSSYQMALDDFAFWTGVKGLPADRVVVGVPFYGYGWGTYKQAWRYADLVARFPGAENQDQIGSGANVIYYNGMATIRDKAVWAQKNAGGIMIWELTQDVAGPKSLLGVIGGVFGAHDSGSVAVSDRERRVPAGASLPKSGGGRDVRGRRADDAESRRFGTRLIPVLGGD
jgi:GH18 family chitinase